MITQLNHKKRYTLVATVLATLFFSYKLIHTADPSDDSAVCVWHHIGKKDSLASIKKHGLLTHRELYKRGLIDSNPDNISGTLPDQYDVIYFTYYADTPPSAHDHIGLKVDPNETYVHNREYRFDGIKYRELYHGSKVLLSAYILNRKKAEQMRKDAPPGKAVIFNPSTSEPFYVNDTDERNSLRACRMGRSLGNSSRHYLYCDEITVPRACIPPEELIFPAEEVAISSPEVLAALSSNHGGSPSEKSESLEVPTMERVDELIIKFNWSWD